MDVDVRFPQQHMISNFEHIQQTYAFFEAY